MSDNNLEIFSKSKLVFECIPDEYGKLILNSILARAINNGTLIEELKLYFNDEEIEDIEDEIGFKIPDSVQKTQRKKRAVKKVEKNLFSSQKENSKSADDTGFDLS